MAILHFDEGWPYEVWVIKLILIWNEKSPVSEKNCTFVSETIGKAARLKFFSPIAFRA